MANDLRPTSTRARAWTVISYPCSSSGLVEGRRLNVVILRWSLRYDVTSSTRIFKPHVLIFVPKSARTWRQRGAPDHTEYRVWQLDAALAACSTRDPGQGAGAPRVRPCTRPRDLHENPAKGHFHIQRSFRGSMCGAPVQDACASFLVENLIEISKYILPPACTRPEPTSATS